MLMIYSTVAQIQQRQLYTADWLRDSELGKHIVTLGFGLQEGRNDCTEEPEAKIMEEDISAHEIIILICKIKLRILSA